MASIEHFEIPADDVSRAKTFYGTVFGFTFEDWDDDNVMLHTGSKDGINGDISKKRDILQHPTVVISVENLEETLEAVKAAGGEQIGEIKQLTETSRWVYFRDSEGNLLEAYDSTD